MSNKEINIPIAILITAFVALVSGGVAAKMYWYPVVTPEPSFINCFNYLGPVQATLLYGAAMVLSVAMLIPALTLRTTTIIYLEGLAILGVIYAGFVSWTAFTYSLNGVALTLDLMLSSLIVVGMAWVLRGQLKRLSTAEILK